jgi:hypothetical protein
MEVFHVITCWLAKDGLHVLSAVTDCRWQFVVDERFCGMGHRGNPVVFFAG